MKKMLGVKSPRPEKRHLSVRVRVVRAFNLQGLAGSDSLCEVSFKKQTFQTSKQAGASPIWGEWFDLGEFEEKDVVDVRVYAKAVDKANLCGSLQITMRDYLRVGSSNKSYPLTAKKGQAAGLLEFEIEVDGDTDSQTFRVPIDVLMANQKAKYPDLKVPIFVRRAIDFLSSGCTGEEGLFRRSGSQDRIQAAQDALDKNYDYNFLDNCKDAHSVAGLIKKFLREIPGSLLTPELGPQFTAAVVGQEGVDSVRLVARALPPANYEILRELIVLLRKCADHPDNKMHSASLAICIGPNLWQPKPGGMLLQESQQIVNLTEFLISKCEQVFVDRDALIMPSVSAHDDSRSTVDLPAAAAAAAASSAASAAASSSDPAAAAAAAPTATSSSSIASAGSAKASSSSKKDGDRKEKRSKKTSSSGSKVRGGSSVAGSTIGNSTSPAAAAAAATASSTGAADSSSAAADASSASSPDPKGKGKDKEDADLLVGADFSQALTNSQRIKASKQDSGLVLYRVKGEWSGRTAGGCLNYPTWRNNVQVFVRTDEDKKVKIKLIQESDTLHHAGFYIAPVDSDERRVLDIDPDNLLAKAGFVNHREIFVEVTLPADEQFVIIPCTFDPSNEGTYKLTLLVEGSLDISLVAADKEWFLLEGEGEWFDESAGGCRNHSKTFANNPQFLIHSAEDSDAVIVVSQSDYEAGEFDMIGAYLFSAPDCKYKQGKFAASSLISKPRFDSDTEAVLKARLKAGMDYIVIPTTFEPGRCCPFRLQVFSSARVQMYPLFERYERSVSARSEWSAASGGGSLAHPSWRSNPQFGLSVEDSPVTASVTLRQLYGHPGSPLASTPVEIGFSIFRVSGAGERVHLVDKSALLLEQRAGDSSSSGNNSKKGARAAPTVVRSSLSLAANDRCVIVPWTAQPCVAARFSLTVQNTDASAVSSGFTLSGLNYDWYRCPSKGEWRASSAAGRSKLLSNPQFYLTLGRSSRVFLLLLATSSSKLGLAVFPVPADYDGSQSLTSGTPLSDSGPMDPPEAALMLSLDAGAYVVVPYTESAGVESLFEIYAHSPSEEAEFRSVGRPLAARLGAAGSSIKLPPPGPEFGGPKAAERVFTHQLTDFEIEPQPIGYGSLGPLYRGRVAGKVVVVRRINAIELRDTDYYAKELAILRRAKHSALLQFIGAARLGYDVLTAQLYSPVGSLFTALSTTPRDALAGSVRVAVAGNISSALQYLHAHKRIHRHLTSRNVIVMDLAMGDVRVADFAFARKAAVSPMLHNIPWTPPDVLLQFVPWTEGSDSFAFGTILWELLHHQAPWAGLTPAQMLERIAKGDRLVIPEHLADGANADDYLDMMRECHDASAQNRPSFTTLLQRLQKMLTDNGAPAL